MKKIYLFVLFSLISSTATAQSQLSQQQKNSFRYLPQLFQVCEREDLQASEVISAIFLSTEGFSMTEFQQSINKEMNDAFTELGEVALESQEVPYGGQEDSQLACQNAIDIFSHGFFAGEAIHSIKSVSGNSWVIVTTLIQTEYYLEPESYPIRMLILDGQTERGKTSVFNSKEACEKELYRNFFDRDNYKLRRTVIGSDLQAARNQNLDVVQCVELKF